MPTCARSRSCPIHRLLTYLLVTNYFRIAGDMVYMVRNPCRERSIRRAQYSMVPINKSLTESHLRGQCW